MSDLFKCKKPGTQCCAPKSKVQEYQLKRNDTSINYQTFYQPASVFATPSAPILQYTSFSYENQHTTTTPRQPIYSKYVCGVKGTGRINGRSHLSSTSEYEPAYDEIPLQPRNARKISHTYEVDLYNNKKTNERLVLGSSLIPIPIIHVENNSTTIDAIISNNASRNKNDTSIVQNYRKGRVVGGEDGENGEWCWQVALINSLNQYLCSGALIGNHNDLLLISLNNHFSRSIENSFFLVLKDLVLL